MKARAFLLAALASGLICVSSGAVLAQALSRGPVKIIIPASPATGPDVVVRLMQLGLSKELGQSVVVENNPGAGDDLGATIVANAAPDGHTLLAGVANYVIEPAIHHHLPFNLATDFKPIIMMANAPLVVITNPNFPPKTIPDLIAYGKAHPPPNAVFFGSTGPGSGQALIFYLLEQRGGVTFSQIPYKGTDQVVTDVLGNHIPMGAVAVATVISLVNSGQLNALGVTTLARSSGLPKIPTVAEQGMPGFEFASWSGLMAPAKTPDAIVDQIYKAALKVMKTPEFDAKLKQQGLELALMNPAEFKTYIDNELKKWDQVIKAAGVKGD